MTILEKILQAKRLEVENLKSKPSAAAAPEKSRPSVIDSIRQADRLQVIAEIKRASPSKGIINEDVDPVRQAQLYTAAGAACISVLTDHAFFKGSFDDLAAVARETSVPLLCKDFIIDEVQIDAAKRAGASVILLIVAALDQASLRRLQQYAEENGLEVLVEVHDLEELARAISAGAQLIGVNNRDLRTFQVDLAKTEEIAAGFPFTEGRVLISESGIASETDAIRAANSGAGAVLVGESLMRSGSVKDAIRALQVKRDGVTS